MKKIIISLLVVAAIIGAFIFVQGRFAENGEGTTPPPPPNPPAGQTVTMRMTDSGYEPKDLSVAVGTVVIFVNGGTNDHWPASNIHPTHEIYPEFDPQKEIKPGESWSFTFDKAGIWRYHDHLFPNLKGTITAADERGTENTPPQTSVLTPPPPQKPLLNSKGISVTELKTKRSSFLNTEVTVFGLAALLGGWSCTEIACFKPYCNVCQKAPALVDPDVTASGNYLVVRDAESPNAFCTAKGNTSTDVQDIDCSKALLQPDTKYQVRGVLRRDEGRPIPDPAYEWEYLYYLEFASAAPLH